VSIVPVTVCYSIKLPGIYGFNSCPDASITNGLWWVAAQAIAGKIQLANMSLGGKDTVVGASAAMDALHQLDVPMVVAAGNDGASPVMSPARDPNAIAVGGTWPNGTWRPDANYGADLDIAAPFQTYALNNIDAPVYAQGTSLSAPIITGLLALKISSDLVPPNYTTGMSEQFPVAMWMAHTCASWDEYKGCGVPRDDFDLRMRDMAAQRYDLNRDCIVDVVDEALIAYHYGSVFGTSYYDVAYDLDPMSYPDLDVDINDLQRVFGRDDYRCIDFGR